MGNDCCAERNDIEVKTRDVDIVADGGKTPDVSYRTRSLQAVKVKYWEDYAADGFVKKLEWILADWPERGQGPINNAFVEIEGRHQDSNHDDVPPGLVAWDHGDVREIIRMYLERHALPPPACSIQAWQSMWYRYEHDKKNLIDLLTTEEFGKFFTTMLYQLASGKAQPVQIAPDVYLASEESVNVKKGDWEKDFVEHIPVMKEVLKDWDDDHEHETMEHLFGEADKDHSGKLVWNDGEIKEFLRNVFKEHKIPFPNLTETQWYNLYRKFSTNMNKGAGMGLSFEESDQFAQFVHQEIVSEERVAVDEMEKKGEKVSSLPPAVTLKAVQGKPLGGYEVHAEAAQAKLDAWDQDPVKRAFDQVAGPGGRGTLQWNGGGIVNFVLKVFELKKLPPPKVDQMTWHNWWMEFDHDHNGQMDPQEATQFAKFVLERILQINRVPVARPVTVVRQENKGVPFVTPAQVVLRGAAPMAVQPVMVVAAPPRRQLNGPSVVRVR